VHEVRDQPFQQHRVTGHGPRPKVPVDRHAVLVGQADTPDQHVAGHLVEPDRHPPRQATVATSEQQQSLDQPFTAFVGVQQVHAQPA
jgi:hypothetical protein